MQFELDDKQAAMFLKWQLKHRKCESKAGAIGGAVSITFVPTGIGMVIESNCGICGKKLSLTDFEDF